MINGMRGGALFAIMCLMLLTNAVKAGVTYYVSDSSGNDAHNGLTWATSKKTIQSAIDAASSGDRILVSNGVYYLASQIDLSKGVAVASVNGAAVTIIDGSNVCRCIRITDSNVSIDGFSIRNGFSTNNGAGVLSLSGGILRHADVYGNVSSNDAMFPNEGGGLYVKGATVEYCNIFSNSTTSGYGGGGLFVDDAGIIRHCAVYGNRSYGSGGGIRVIDDDDTPQSASVEECSIYDNRAYNGGGVRIYRGGTFLRCRIYGNVAYERYGGGAAVAGGTLRGCVIYSNSAALDGGGVDLWMSSATVDNCTIVGNQAGGSGGGISVHGGDNGTGLLGTNVIRNCILFQNAAVSNGTDYSSTTDAVFVCDYTCVNPVPPDGIGNFSGAPIFANAAQSDFRLKATSPCVDAGTNLDWMTTAMDIEGQPRIFNGRVDVGADETFIGALGIVCTGQVTTSWQMVLDARHQFQFSTNLMSPNWNNIGGVSTALQWQATLVDTNGIGPSRFYRLLWLRP